MKKFVFALILFISVLPNVFGSGLLLQENKGQFHPNVKFKAALNFGAFFIEEGKLTFVLHDKDQLSELIESIHHHEKPKSLSFNSHTFSIDFVGFNKNANYLGSSPSAHHYNYFQGNVPSKWVGNVKAYHELTIQNLYPNIDFHLFSKDNSIKYEFIVKPGGNIADIKMHYNNTDLSLNNNSITIKTSVGELIDERPVSFYKSNVSNLVSTNYILSDNTVSFNVGSYDKSQTFVLDPELRFASFTGSTIDNWGFTATYDEEGNAYAGGVAFGTGYPTTVGAFQTTFGGPSGEYKIDISISKFNKYGDKLMYSTYLGGNGLECPHSMVVNSNNELVVFGTTSSTNYPTTNSSYDQSFNGGDNVLVDNVLAFTGSDIVVTKFSADGGSLIGSTYYGGSKNDGFNDEKESFGLYHNYSDIFRGEVITDGIGNIYIATTTSSADLPIQGGFNNTFSGGTYDGVIAKFNGNLSNLIWSSYVGGSAEDAVYAVQPHSNGDVYITGGTSSSDFPTTGKSNQPTYQGNIDGFLARISSDGSSILASTYIGTSDYDQSYFVQVDSNNYVYVYGQTEGNMPVIGSVYNNPNSGQFIHKYQPDLSSIDLSTVVGKGSGSTELVPSAFLVNYCGQIYLSGWAGAVNSTYSGGSTYGMPITNDAFQSSTDGSDFYLMLLDKDFSSLKYSTYFGGTGAKEHVDGGTSRFDKKGVVYQSVCAGCGGTSAFPVTVGAWSETNNATNCNLGIFKFDVSKLTSVIAASTDTLVCAKDTIHFVNGSNGGTSYKWIFHDGVTSNTKDTWRIIDVPGNYSATLIANDPSACPGADTTKVQFSVLALPDIDILTKSPEICLGDSLTIKAQGAIDYKWFNSNFSLITDTGIFKTYTDTSGSIYVTAHNSKCKSDTEVVTYKVFVPPSNGNYSFTKCDYENASLPIPYQADYTYTWNPPNSVVVAKDSAYFFPKQNTNYELTVKGKCGEAKINYNIDVITIDAKAGPDTIICPNDTINIYASGGSSYNWSPSINIEDSSKAITKVSPDKTTDYIVKISEGKCFKFDTAKVIVYPKPFQDVKGEYTIKFGESQYVALDAKYQYKWTPRSFLNCDNCPEITSTPDEDITYYFTYTDDNHCLQKDSVKINVIFDLWIANTFTPNGDGRNDVFYAYSHVLKDFHMDIYNRWGELIFSSDDLKVGWDGTVNGRPAQIDTYVYKLRYTRVHTREIKTKIGHVNLLR